MPGAKFPEQGLIVIREVVPPATSTRIPEASEARSRFFTTHVYQKILYHLICNWLSVLHRCTSERIQPFPHMLHNAFVLGHLFMQVIFNIQLYTSDSWFTRVLHWVLFGSHHSPKYRIFDPRQNSPPPNHNTVSHDPKASMYTMQLVDKAYHESLSIRWPFWDRLPSLTDERY